MSALLLKEAFYTMLCIDGLNFEFLEMDLFS